MSLSKTSREDLKEMIRRCHTAILSIGAQPPVGQRGFPKDWAIGPIVREAREAYGYTPPKRRFEPSPKDLDDMLPVLMAIADYRKHALHGRRNYKIIFCRAYDLPWHRIRDELRTTAGERSLQRWQDRACEEIIRLWLTTDADTEQNRVLRVNNCA